MDPVSFAIEIELGTVLIAAVGALAAYLRHRQRERHHRDGRRPRPDRAARTRSAK